LTFNPLAGNEKFGNGARNDSSSFGFSATVTRAIRVIGEERSDNRSSIGHRADREDELGCRPRPRIAHPSPQGKDWSNNRADAQKSKGTL
jgi:hypothetical protein